MDCLKYCKDCGAKIFLTSLRSWAVKKYCKDCKKERNKITTQKYYNENAVTLRLKRNQRYQDSK